MQSVHTECGTQLAQIACQTTPAQEWCDMQSVQTECRTQLAQIPCQTMRILYLDSCIHSLLETGRALSGTAQSNGAATERQRSGNGSDGVLTLFIRTLKYSFDHSFQVAFEYSFEYPFDESFGYSIDCLLDYAFDCAFDYHSPIASFQYLFDYSID